MNMTVEFTKSVLAARDAQAAHAQGAAEFLVPEKCVITPSAQDYLRQHDITVRKRNSGGTGAGALKPPAAASAHTRQQARLTSPEARLFYSEEAERIKAEIIAVGRKLWSRMYVDGNGGNISYRIGPNAVICTPTMVSKADLTPDDLCLVDLDGNQILGPKPRTSEVFLHLEIYKAVPEAKAAVHCHPPHATAYAITRRVPPSRLIPEYEVFVGKVAVAPYETPGTPEFAQTVLPFVKQHNTVLLSNHGIVCWADTVTHAEWYAEVIDTYCWTLMLATQLGAPLSYIPEEKASDLLAIKKRLGLPDVRLDGSNFKECQLSDLEMPTTIALLPNACVPGVTADGIDVEAVVKSVTDAVMRVLEER